MAIGRSRPRTSADQIIHDQLEILGNLVYSEAKANSRVSRSHMQRNGHFHRGGTLRDSINYQVRGTTLKVGQVYYGKYQRPNELQVAIDRNLPNATSVIVAEITQWLTP